MAYKGEVVFQHVFDLGGTIDVAKAKASFGTMIVSETVHTPRAVPENVYIEVPLVLDLSSLGLDLQSEDGQCVNVSARLYEVGALAVSMRFCMKEETLSGLARYQHLKLKTGGTMRKRIEVVNSVFGTIKSRLKGCYEEVFNVPVDPESYTAFCLTEATGGAARVLRDERAAIAGLLINEPHPEKLSLQQIEDVTRLTFSYYDDDVTITDWDAAFVIEPNAVYEDLLYVFEVANLQLLLMRKYDRYLDIILERGYEDYERLFKRMPMFFGKLRDMVRDLSEVRMDLAKVTDQLDNTAKFFGDWYVARIYMSLAKKLHLDDYEKVVDEKLVTLNDLYQSVLAETQTRQNLVLEWAIVLLIVFEIFLLF